MKLGELQTPALLLDEGKLRRNIAEMQDHFSRLGVAFRPHLKTAKSLDVARVAMTASTGPAMVSTLREAEYFEEGGVKDMIYGVGIVPSKLGRVSSIRSRGVDLAIILDTVGQAEAVVRHVEASGDRIPALIEIDGDGHRSGVAPSDVEKLIAIGRLLSDGAELRGVLIHAGGSYALSDPDALAAVAEAERSAAVSAAETLRATGMRCPVVSVGSTPTARFARNLAGVTEVRAGVFMFGDLYQAGVGSIPIDGIALSVLCSVIGHQSDKGCILVDAGWMAMSRDRGTATQPVDQGYGLVCDAAGRVLGDLIMIDANQEHGVLALRAGSTATLPNLPVGALLRILPNHACATGAQFDRYHVLDSDNEVTGTWSRINGW